MKLPILGLTLLFCVLEPMLCWWDVGHMLTAAIAEIRLNQLDPFASIQIRQLVTSINKLCDGKSQTFIESASWADDIKQKNYSMHVWDAWHFKDGPFVQDGTIPTINYTTTAVNSVNVIKSATNVLKANVLKKTAERALFARYLIHVTGDIHQPLHSVALFNATYPAGDYGGNLLKIKVSNGSLQNFHSFWDAGANLVQNDSWVLPRPLNDQNLTVLKQVANSLIKQFGDQVQQLGKNIDPAVWAEESFRIAVNTTYPHTFKSNQATPEYTLAAYEVCKKRITLGGYRLANIIIDIYKGAENLTKKSKSETIQDHFRDDLKTLWNDLQSEVPEINQDMLNLINRELQQLQ